MLYKHIEHYPNKQYLFHSQKCIIGETLLWHKTLSLSGIVLNKTLMWYLYHVRIPTIYGCFRHSVALQQ